MPPDTMLGVSLRFVFCCLLPAICGLAQDGKRASYPSFPYDVARAHEIAPHRRNIPLDGVGPGFHQLRLTLTVSPRGEVLDANAGGDRQMLRFWPQLQSEVRQWKFVPFEINGMPVTAELEEYIDLVPPERLPRTHVNAPVLRSDSRIVISLERTGCLGSCPSYTVIVSTDGVVFTGRWSVVASGKHTDAIDAAEVRKLASHFVAADFYSMDANYRASATDLPTYKLSILIDGRTKEVVDYAGLWVGMPAIIEVLENETDALARTQRWIEGGDGLVQAMQAERFNFQSFEAQVILKEAASRGASATVRELLKAGVPLKRLSVPKSSPPFTGRSFANVGWLTAASGHPQALQILIDAAASKNDQGDKDVALVGAARSGSIISVRRLIAYGANPNADPKNLVITEDGGGMTMEGPGAGSVLIYAALSGNPEILREILRYHPELEARDHEGKTALFAAGEWRNSDEDGARVACVRLLVRAGANVNARDNDGNTPLHETFLTDVEEELLRLGANVNARNKDGETPIFTTVDDDAVPLFIKHGADLTIRNKKGETVVEAAKAHGPIRQEALRKAIQELKRR
jgi:ankyrin repeat protein